MADSTSSSNDKTDAIYSQAFNFASFVQHGVDPRTGLYSASIALLAAHVIEAPPFSLTLRYSPLSTVNIGFGIGWGFNLSRYDRKAGRLALASGENYQVDPRQTAGAMTLKDAKLKTVRMEWLADGQYKITQKSGLVTVLSDNKRAYDVAVPVALFAPSGHRLTLAYDYAGGNQRLSSVKADKREILKITYPPGKAVVTLHGGSSEQQIYTLLLKNDELSELKLPDGMGPGWEFGYETPANASSTQRYLTELSTPTGLKEHVTLRAAGHAFPAKAPFSHLPYVTSLKQYPGAGQPMLHTTYEYSPHNFLGAGSGFDWHEGEDNLYLTREDYIYHSTESQEIDGHQRSIKRIFNRFHLLVSEAHSYKGKTVTHSTEYDLKKGASFAAQPAQCQLPKEQTVSWQDGVNGTPRTETTTLEFDESGNLLSQISPSGLTRTQSWYAAEGKSGECPADPFGFVNYQATLTETARQADKATDKAADGTTTNTTTADTTTDTTPLPSRLTRYHYKSLPGPTGAPAAYCVLRSEEHAEGRASVYNDYYNLPQDLDQHGRLKQQRQVINGHTTTTDYVYQLTEDVISTSETLTGFDNTSRKRLHQISRHTGKTLQQENAEGAVQRYGYDALGRIKQVETAPGTAWAATRSYHYVPRTDSESNHLEATSETGLCTRTHYDGLGRVIRTQRQADGGSNDAQGKYSAPYRELERRVYDSAGRLSTITAVDWLQQGDAAQPLDPLKLETTQTLEYDEWGQHSSTLFADGRREITRHNPVTLTREKTTETSEGLQGVEETLLNVEGKPRQIRRIKPDKSVESTHTLRYDGWGRLAEETDGDTHTTKYDYDDFDRLTTTTRADGHTVNRHYAAHSAKTNITGILLDREALGQQDFDGLDRLKKHTSGNNSTTYSYNGSALRPASVTMPDSQMLTYQYQPHLGGVMKQLVASDTTLDYDFHPDSGLLKAATSSHNVHSHIRHEFDYHRSGRLRSERYQHGKVAYTTQHVFSHAGRRQSFTDAFNVTHTTEYDAQGRVKQLTMGTLTATVTYDAAGRPRLTEVKESGTGTKLSTLLGYDSFGREISRTLTTDKQTCKITHDKFTPAGQLALRKIYLGDKLVLEESFSYDALKRLKTWTCTGSTCPADASGNTLNGQTLDYDTRGNFKTVTSEFANGENDIATYHYNNKDDPAQLSQITHSHASWPDSNEMRYQAGRMYVDEAGRQLSYNPQGLLSSVYHANGTPAAIYHYDALNRLMSLEQADSTRTWHYRDGQVIGESDYNRGQTSYLRHGRRYLGGQTDQETDLSELLGLDAQQSVILSVLCTDGSVANSVYTPFGYRHDITHHPLARGLGFTGQRQDPITGCYHLGNGYRQYNPLLRCFTTADSLSPLGAGGIHSYAYCDNDPVNRNDPSGHFSLELDSWIGIGFGALGIGLGAFTLGTTAVWGVGLMAAEVGGIISGTLAVGTGIASGFGNDKLAEGLSTASYALGLTSAALSLAGKVAMKLSSWAARRGMLTAEELRSITPRSISSQTRDAARLVAQLTEDNSLEMRESVLLQIEDNHINPHIWRRAVENLRQRNPGRYTETLLRGELLPSYSENVTENLAEQAGTSAAGEISRDISSRSAVSTGTLPALPTPPMDPPPPYSAVDPHPIPNFEQLFQ